uniref:aminodeoxychorismate synthase n=1 Tax=Candidatus Aschnera chinzeii TaxID=1485666 RepID=A0AAT9G3S3_9ENTR|nr:MAG: aminodeoxychorismate synthase component 1 [Candidatus Aschnera chinzeii]
MNIQMVNLPYSLYSALNYFNNISHLPWSMLLYSGNSDHRYNRFDIIVADPFLTFITYNDNTIIVGKNKKYVSKEDPFELLKYEMKAINFSTSCNHDLPFQGGAVGIYSYDIIRRIECLSNKAINELHCPDMAIGIYLWGLIVDHHKKNVTLFSYQDIKKRLLWLKQQVPWNSKKFEINGSWHSNMTKDQYYDKYNIINDYLHNGDCYQINLAQRFKVAYHGDEWNAFLKLNTLNKAPFSAFIRLPSNCIISLSPERFLFLYNKIIQTRPIKGTLPKLDNDIDDYKQIKRLQLSSKDRAENVMIVDLLRNDIGKVAIPGSITVPEIFLVESFASVHHLVSTIQGKLLPEYHPLDLLKACFPGGSITGAPKIRAMEIIEQLEPHRRHIYCGTIGYISFCGTMDTNITIRTLLTENNFIYCWGGGGIILDSIVDKEYQEIFDKLKTILSI